MSSLYTVWCLLLLSLTFILYAKVRGSPPCPQARAEPTPQRPNVFTTHGPEVDGPWDGEN